MISEREAEERQKDMEAFFSSLDFESDRGMVLAASCYFEELLRSALQSYFSNFKETEELLKDGLGLGTFSMRNKCCLALRIIEREEYDTLRLMARIRNKFAHNIRASFEDNPLADLTKEMAKVFFQENHMTWPRIKEDQPRELFSFTALCLSDKLWLRPYDAALHVATYPCLLPEHADELLQGKKS